MYVLVLVLVILALSTTEPRLDFSMVSLRFSLTPLNLVYRMTDVSYGGLLPWMRFLVHSHGIPEEVIDNTVKAAKRYFSLPEATKMEVSCLCFKIGLPYYHSKHAFFE